MLSNSVDGSKAREGGISYEGRYFCRYLSRNSGNPSVDAAEAGEHDHCEGCEIAHLKEVITAYHRMLFGSKSEKTVYLNHMDQLSLFHSQPVPQKKEEYQTSVVKEHVRAKKSKRNREDYIRLMIESGKSTVDPVIYDLPESERFDENGKPL